MAVRNCDKKLESQTRHETRNNILFERNPNFFVTYIPTNFNVLTSYSRIGCEVSANSTN